MSKFSGMFSISNHIRISITREANKCKTIIKLNYIHNHNHHPMNN